MNSVYKSAFVTTVAVLMLLYTAGCAVSDINESSLWAESQQEEPSVIEQELLIETSIVIRTKGQMMQDFLRDGQTTLSGPAEAEIFLAACQEDSEFYNLFFQNLEIPELTPEEDQAALDAYKQQVQQEVAEQFQNGQHEYDKPDMDTLLEDVQNQLDQEATDENDDFMDYDPSLSKY